jgi:hypothetical protein
MSASISIAPSLMPTISPQASTSSNDSNPFISYYYAGFIAVLVLSIFLIFLISYLRYRRPMRNMIKDLEDPELTIGDAYSDTSNVADTINPRAVILGSNQEPRQEADDFIGYLQGKYSYRTLLRVHQRSQEAKSIVFEKPVVLKKENKVNIVPLDENVHVRPFMYNPRSRQHFQGRSDQGPNDSHDRRRNSMRNNRGAGRGFHDPRQLFRSGSMV